MAEPEELQEDAGSLVPAITAILTAAAAYAATNKAVSDAVDMIDNALGITAKAGAVLTNIAMKMVTAQIAATRSRAEKAELSLAATTAVPRAVDDAVTVIARSAAAVLDKQRQVLRKTGRTKVSAPGMIFTDDLPGDSDDPKTVARRAAQTVRNSAVFNLAEQVPFTYRKTWHDVGDARVRATHAFLGSPKYEFHTVDLGDKFVTIAGNRLRFPGDPLAPIEETAHCRCWLTIARHSG